MDEIPSATEAFPACPKCTKGAVVSYCYRLPYPHDTFTLKPRDKLQTPLFTLDLSCRFCGWRAKILVAEQEARKKPRTVPERERIVALVVKREEVKEYGKGQGPYLVDFASQETHSVWGGRGRKW